MTAPGVSVMVSTITVGMLAVLSAQPVVSLRLQQPSITAGEFATVVVSAGGGTSVQIRSDAPGVPPQTVVLSGGEQSVRLGPFVHVGDYRVTATAGSQPPVVVNLRVGFPQEATKPLGATNTSYDTAAEALIDVLNAGRTGVSRLPTREPTIAEAKAAMDELQRQLADIRRSAAETGDTFDAVRRQLEADGNVSREAKDEFARLEEEINQNLTEQARQLRELGREAEQPAADSCAAAMAVSTALQGQRSTMNAMRTGVGDLQAGQSRREQGASGASGAGWRAIKAKIEDLVRTGQAGSYAEAERSIGRATGPNGLGGYATRQCDKFTGEWSGTTYVEALDKGEPFYGLQNDWRAQVEIAVTRQSEGGADAERPLRGTLTGRAHSFKVVNQLRSLYAGRPAQSIEFLTADPSAAQQASATFVAAVEGFVRGRQMTLKIRPGGTDYAGRLTGKMAAVVIPMGSPVPLVQTYPVVFQGGHWQLSRAVGPSGITERPFTITTGGDKRLVQERYPRSLSTSGARGRFTIDIRLCSGCDT